MLECPSCQSRSARRWEKGSHVTNLYYDSDISLEELGGMLGVGAKNKRSGPEQEIKRFIKAVHARCSPELQERFPLAEIPIGKPLTDRLKDRKSQGHGGLMLKVRQQIRDGASKVESIAQSVGVPTGAVWEALNRLAKRGEQIPQSSTKKIRKLLERAREAKAYGEISEVLAQSPDANYFYKRNSDIYISLTDVIRQCGFRIRSQDMKYFLAILEEKRIPIKSFDHVFRGEKIGSYHFVMKQEIGAISETFRLSRRLARFKELKTLRQVTKLKVDLPSTTLIEKGIGFRSVFRHLEKMGIDKEVVLKNSPVPIFAWKPRVVRGRVYCTYIVKNSDFAALMEFAGRLKEDDSAEH